MTTLEHEEWMKENSLTSPEDRNKDNKWRPSIGVPCLTPEQTEAAMKELNITSFVDRFPKVERIYTDPAIQLQKIGLISFVPAKGAKPNENGIFGFAKLRGNYETSIEANQRSEDIIKYHDSYHKIYHAYVGRPFPLTMSSQYSAEVSEVDIRKEIAENISHNIKQIKKDEEKEIQEIKHREQQLLEESEKAKRGEATEEPEDVYVTLQVKRAQLCWTYLEHLKKMDEVRGIIIKTRQELSEMDSKDPELKKSYYKKYMDARKKSGLDNNIRNAQDNFIKYLVEDVFLPGIDDLKPGEVPISPPIPPVGFSKYDPDAVPELVELSPNTTTTTTTENKKKNKKHKKKNKK